MPRTKTEEQPIASRTRRAPSSEEAKELLDKAYRMSIGSAGAIKEIASQYSKENALEIVLAIKDELENQIRAVKLEAFIPLLLVALAKDLMDVIAFVLNLLSLGFLGLIINIFVSLILWYIYLKSFLRPLKSLRRSSKKKLLEKFWTKFILAAVFESTGFNIVPGWTIQVLLMKHDSNKELRKFQSELREIERAYAGLGRRII